MAKLNGDAPPPISVISGTPDHGYDDKLDSIVDWSINRKESTVTLVTERSTDGSRRNVPEDAIQRQNEAKLIDYWKSFRKPREQTVKCANYRIFNILAHRAGKTPKLLIHWVGYTADPADGSASWEPVSNMLASSDGPLVQEYLNHHELTHQLTAKKRAGPVVGTPAAAKSAPLTATPSSKRRRASSAAPAVKRPRRFTSGPQDNVAAASGVPKDEEQVEDLEKEVKSALKSATKAKPRATARASQAAVASPDSRQARATASQDGLFTIELSISGLPHRDIRKLSDLAAELSAQANAVSISSKVTPL